MATPTPSNPTFAPLLGMNKYFSEIVPSLTFPSNVTLANLVNRGAVIINPGNAYFNWDVVFGGASGSWVSYNAASTVSDTNVTIPAVIPDTQKRAYYRFQIDRINSQNVAQTAPRALASVIKKHLKDGTTEILRTINKAILAPQTGSDIISFASILDDTISYAGIAPSGASAAWIPTIDKSGTERAFTRDLMLKFDATVAKAGTYYDYVSMHPDQVLKYIKAYDTVSPVASLMQNQNPAPFKQVDLGYGEVTYNGLPIVQERELPVGEIRYLKTDDVELQFRDLTGGIGFGMDGNKPLVVNNSLGIPIHIAEINTGIPTVAEYEMFAMVQMVVRNRTSAMALKNISV